MSTTKTLHAKNVAAIVSEIKTLRNWLDYLERDIASEQGVISVVILKSINESSMNLVYRAGMDNGAALQKYEE